jgi:hypothetical protein
LESSLSDGDSTPYQDALLKGTTPPRSADSPERAVATTDENGTEKLNFAPGAFRNQYWSGRDLETDLEGKTAVC